MPQLKTDCDHHNLNQSLVGLHCPKCNTTWRWSDSLAMSQVYRQMCARYDALEHRVLGIEDALVGRLGLAQCMKCHGYDKRDGLFHLLGSLTYCVLCLREVLKDPDDETLELGNPAFHDGLVEDIARQALRLHVGGLDWSDPWPDIQRAIDSLRRTDGATIHSVEVAPCR